MTCVKECSNGKALFAERNFSKGEVIGRLEGNVENEPGVHSIQISAEQHLNVTNNMRYISHHCRNANCIIDFSCTPLWTVKAVCDVARGERLTFDYVTTEYKMAACFDCLCGGALCRKSIRGFYNLSETEQNQMLENGECSPVFQELVKRNYRF